MDKFDEFISILRQWETGGKRILKNGAEQICHVPHVAPAAWLHLIYAGLSNKQIKLMEKDLNQKLPKDVNSFLIKANGINIFSDSLSIFGYRSSFSRIGDEAIQPYDLSSENQDMRSYKPASWLGIGGYSWDGSTVFYDLSASQTEVFRCERYSTIKVNRWESIIDWLMSETKRLSGLFDSTGKKIDKSIPTTP